MINFNYLVYFYKPYVYNLNVDNKSCQIKMRERIENMTNTMNIIQIENKGTQEFMGKEIPVIYGGFGKEQKVILAKTVAEIHNMKLFHVNELINRNIQRFKEGIDFLDLKVIVQNDNNLLSDCGFTKMQISKANNIYLLSERGYAKLIKIMDTDLAWEVHDNLMDEYFAMREIINSSEQLKASLLLSIYNGGQEGVLASKQLTEIEVGEATKPLLETIEQQKPCVDYVDAVMAQKDSILVRQVCKIAYTEKQIEIGERKLYNVLRHWGLVCANSTEPTQKALDSGYLEVDCKVINTAYGEREVYTTLVKPRGQVYIVQKLAKLTQTEINDINKSFNEKKKKNK